MVARHIPINNKVFALSTFNFDLKWDVCKMVVRYEYLDSSVIFCPGIYLDSSVIILSGDIIWNHRYILSCIYTWKPALHSVRVYNLKTALYSVWVYNMKPALYSVRENTWTRALYSVRVYNMKRRNTLSGDTSLDKTITCMICSNMYIYSVHILAVGT